MIAGGTGLKAASCQELKKAECDNKVGEQQRKKD